MDKASIQKIVESIRILHNGNYNEEFPLNSTLSKKILSHIENKNITIEEKLETYKLTNARRKFC